MFWWKKIISMLAAPATVILVLLVVGLWRFLRPAGSWRRGGVWLVLGTVCFYLCTTAPLPQSLVNRLEGRYAAITHLAADPAIPYIVVLSGGIRSRHDVPPTSLLDDFSIARVVEGIRLFYLLKGKPLLVMSGGGPGAVGDRMAALARSLGIPADKVLSETNSLDTHGNAREVKAIVHNAPFLLVTSAAHMPRAMAIFQLLGLRPVPAPADFRGQTAYRAMDLWPAGVHLRNLEMVLHEYLGLAYLRLFPSRAGR